MAWSNSIVSLDGGSMDSLEETTVTAPLTSPMLNLAETRLANKVSGGFEDLALVVFLGGGSGTTEPETNASSLLLIKVACEMCRLTCIAYHFVSTHLHAKV